jgi:hypothetical protein
MRITFVFETSAPFVPDFAVPLIAGFTAKIRSATPNGSSDVECVEASVFDNEAEALHERRRRAGLAQLAEEPDEDEDQLAFYGLQLPDDEV